MKRYRDPRGFALLAVTVFVLVLTTAGMIFFSLSSYETKQALYRQRSSEAFYLADAGVEHARAKFIEDLAWHTDTTGIGLGQGAFDLAVTDTTYLGDDNCRKLIATGHVQGADRRVEVIARVPPSTLGVPLFVGGDFDAGGNLCIEGTVHVNGDGDDQHLACDYHFQHGFDLTPPAVYTEPDSFPNGTYYYVRGDRQGTDYIGKVYLRDGTTQVPVSDNMVDVTTYNSGSGTFQFNFNSVAELDKYFTGANPIFACLPGDIAAVVNFGDVTPYDPPGGLGPNDLVADVTLDVNGNRSVHATVINTRFIGSTLEDRVNTNRWKGGHVTVKQIKFEPYYGIAMICYDFGKQGGSQVQIGSPTYPALLYVTGDVGDPDQLNSNFVLYGSVICLGDWHSTGGPTIYYDDGFIDNLPGYLGEDWPGGASGTLKVLRWREIAAN